MRLRPTILMTTMLTMLAILLVVVPSPVQAQDDTPPPATPADRAALAALYHATNGANWLSNVPLDEWHGVATDQNGRGVALDIDSNLLRGELPANLDTLSNLQQLSLFAKPSNRPAKPWLASHRRTSSPGSRFGLVAARIL